MLSKLREVKSQPRAELLHGLRTSPTASKAAGHGRGVCVPVAAGLFLDDDGVGNLVSRRHKSTMRHPCEIRNRPEVARPQRPRGDQGFSDTHGVTRG